MTSLDKKSISCIKFEDNIPNWDNNKMWWAREIAYWEIAFDRLIEQYNEIKKTIEAWKSEHAKVVSLLNQRDAELAQVKSFWKSEHAKVVSLLNQRDAELTQVKSFWENEHAKVVSLLNQRDAELIKERENWKEERAKLVAQVEQWVTWYKSLEEDCDHYKKLCEEENNLIEQLKIWNNKLLKNPFLYITEFIRLLFNIRQTKKDE